MRTYCKDADPTSMKWVVPAVWDALHGKWRRQDYGRMLVEYSAGYENYTLDDIHLIAVAVEYKKFEPIIERIAKEVIRRVKTRDLDLSPVKYEERRDPGSGKLRLVGIEDPFHQVCDHVAVYCLMELFRAKIEPCQFASIKGRGPVRGAHLIQSWVKAENDRAWYCNEHGYRCTKTTEYYIQGDVRKCYPSMRREMAMKLLRHDISKNDTLLWMVDELLKMHQNGFIIGSLLSQFLCNYIMSFAIREAFCMTKERRGKKMRLVYHQVWYMDDFILTGTDARNLKMAYTRLGKYMKDRFGLELKDAHVYRWCERPPDIMGYVIHSDGTITIRPRDFIKARRVFVRANRQELLTLVQARLIVSYKGYFVNSDCTQATKKYHVIETAKKAQKLISDYDTGRLMQCITRLSSTAATPLLSPSSSTQTVLQNTV